MDWNGLLANLKELTCEIMCLLVQFVAVQLLSHVWLFVTPWTETGQSSLSITTPGACSNSCPLSQWCHPVISSSVIPFSFCPNLSQHQSLFKCVSFSHQVAKILEFQLQRQSFQWTPRTNLLDGMVGCLYSSRDSQESSPTPQFKSINSSVLSFLYSLTLTSIHDY